MKRVRIGCSGWSYRDWRGPFYPSDLPQRHWLEYYAGAFQTVEVNATFYRLPALETVAAWAGQAPAGFLFAIKASRYLTHVKRLAGAGEGYARLHERLEPLVKRGKLGPLLWQLPETFQRDDARLAGALDALPPGRHCFEFRHPSWFCEEIYARLRERGAALVIGHHPERPFQALELTAPFTYIRFHYGGRGRGGNYSERELGAWAERIAAWRERVEVFAYFNNDQRARAPHNAQLLGRLLDRAGPGRGRAP